MSSHIYPLVNEAKEQRRPSSEFNWNSSFSLMESLLIHRCRTASFGDEAGRRIDMFWRRQIGAPRFSFNICRHTSFSFFLATITMTASPAREIAAAAATPKKKPGQSWKANETHVLPHNRLFIVSLGMLRTDICG